MAAIDGGVGQADEDWRSRWKPSGIRPFRDVIDAGILLLFSGYASAHSFGQTYVLPVPVWLYLYGAAAALVLSFLIVGYFITGVADDTDRGDKAGSRSRPARGCNVPTALVVLLRVASVAALVLAIVAGLVGSDSAYRNINMTLFWVIFGLGFTYLTAIIGDWYAVFNPYKVLVDWVESCLPSALKGRVSEPERFGYWPAIGLYMAFVWLELFGGMSPWSLSQMLVIYFVINVIGCWWVGKTAWFQYGEFYGVFLRLIAKIAPLGVEIKQPQAVADGEVVAGAQVAVRLRKPGSGLVQSGPVPLSLLVFVLLMLSSTAFDGLHKTALWIGAFWENLYQLVLMPLYGDAPDVSFEAIKRLFLIYQTVAFTLSPFVYLAVYALFIALSRGLARSTYTVTAQMQWFALSLVPIVLSYHISHYFTLLIVQGAEIIRLISDPLGRGWDLFGTAEINVTVLPDMGMIWHIQVFLIVAGHVVSVYLAHLQAMKLFASRRAAILSQIPILVLMVIFTAVGLWILSLPYGGKLGGG